ncbi:MAG: S8 family serine peptidase, partial [Oscillospiraceae bacterium]|nr:S8 family serine peptidase [Oscillospiraceae bacterium]
MKNHTLRSIALLIAFIISANFLAPVTSAQHPEHDAGHIGCEELGHEIEHLAEQLLNEGYIGQGVKIAILDSGIDSQILKGGVSYIEGNPYDIDDYGHGNPVSDIISGIAPSSELYSLKVLNEKGVGEADAIIDAIHWSIANNIDIIYFGFTFDAYTEELLEAVREANAKNIIMIAPAGNDSSSQAAFPAAFNEVISVGAITDGEISGFSNYGEYVNVYTQNASLTYQGTSFNAAMPVAY